MWHIIMTHLFRFRVENNDECVVRTDCKAADDSVSFSSASKRRPTIAVDVDAETNRDDTVAVSFKQNSSKRSHSATGTCEGSPKRGKTHETVHVHAQVSFHLHNLQLKTLTNNTHTNSDSFFRQTRQC